MLTYHCVCVFQLAIILGGPVMASFGYFNVIMCSFVLKILLALLLFTVGPSPSMLIFFYLFDRYR